MKTLAIDPGPQLSGWCVVEDGKVLRSGVLKNYELLDMMLDGDCDDCNYCAVEMIASYGMPVGAEVFETCVFIGRIQQCWDYSPTFFKVFRREVKLHLCGSPRAKDGNVRQAIIDLYPATGGGKTPQIGTKAEPGPLYGMSSHAWPALGVALTLEAQLREGKHGQQPHL